MNNKLQELTDKIYNEGVEKGNEEAAKLIAQAEAKAKAIIEEATKKAQEIETLAQNKASELDKNTRSELKLFAQQAVNVLKTEITDLLSDQISTDSVKAATTDKAFMQGIIVNLCDQWAKNDTVCIETKDAKALEAYFQANAKELLNSGVSIKEANGIKTDFAVTLTKGGYKMTFGDAEFIAYFKEFLRPQLVEMLF